MEKIIPLDLNYYRHVLFNVLFFGAIVIAGIIGAYILLKITKLFLKRIGVKYYDLFHYHLQSAIYLLIPVILVYSTSNLYITNPHIISLTNRIFPIILISTITWVVIRSAYLMEALVFLKYDVSKADNRKERKVITQTQFIKRLFIIIVVIIAASLILMSFDSARKIGQGILTSAGVAGIIIGVAAQRSLANLLAGFQIAFSQPIKIEDVVVIEGEYGKVEEINLTYVVIRLWDLRRLVVPLSYFLEKPFQNWSRETSDIIGSIIIYVDYNVPMEELRKELMSILKSSRFWDNKVGNLQVTNVMQNNIELRALVSARNSGDGWELRCEVREKLITFLQQNYPYSFPKFRNETQGTAGINQLTSI